MTEAGLLEASELDGIDGQVGSLIDQAVSEAEAAPRGTDGDLLTDVYMSY